MHKEVCKIVRGKLCADRKEKKTGMQRESVVWLCAVDVVKACRFCRGPRGLPSAHSPVKGKYFWLLILPLRVVKLVFF